MAAEYLDLRGLGTLWGKVKAYADGKVATTRRIRATLEDGTETVLEVPIITEEAFTGITLSGTSGASNVGKSFTLTATLSNIEGDVTWSSSDEAVATVSGGTVTCVAEGSCVITATCGGYSAEYNLTVAAAEIACTEILSGDFNYSAGVTVSSSAGSKVTTFRIAPANTTDTFIVRSNDTSIVTVGGVTYSEVDVDGSTYKEAAVTLNAVSVGRTTIECTCGSKSFKATTNVVNGESALSEVLTYAKASDAITAQIDLSTCCNTQENVFYFGSESGASGWSGAASGNAALYMYYYADTKKLEVDGVVWGSCMTGDAGREYTLTDDQLTDVKVEINSTDGIKVTAGGTTLFQYAYVDSDTAWDDIWSSWNTSAVAGYGQDNAPSNATYADGWLTYNGTALAVE